MYLNLFFAWKDAVPRSRSRRISNVLRFHVEMCGKQANGIKRPRLSFLSAMTAAKKDKALM